MLKYRWLKTLNTTGDTIVEVMVVLAILGLAISISYATANRSLLNTRQAQENSQATELLQSQIENLRAFASSGSASANNIFIPSQYCIYISSLDGQNHVATPTSTPNYNSECAHYVASSLYTIKDVFCGTGGDTGDPLCVGTTGSTFVVNASWPDVEGLGQDTVTLSYRLYQ